MLILLLIEERSSGTVRRRLDHPQSSSAKYHASFVVFADLHRQPPPPSLLHRFTAGEPPAAFEVKVTDLIRIQFVLAKLVRSDGLPIHPREECVPIFIGRLLELDWGDTEGQQRHHCRWRQSRKFATIPSPKRA